MSDNGYEKLRELIAERPDLPIICLAPSTPFMYSLPWGTRESTPVERVLDLCESTSSMKQESPGFSRGECQTYYHDVYGASIEKLLFPNEVNRLYSFPCKGLPNGMAFSYFGLNPERYYDDVDEVAEDIEDWLWDSECGQYFDVDHQNLKCHDWVTDGWIQTYRPIARMMAEDMPWHEYIVIDCY